MQPHDTTPSKVCTKCGTEKPSKEFSRFRQSPDGLAYWCKTCFAEYHRAWRVANRERRAEYIRAWNEANPEHKAEYMRAYYAANRERMDERTRKWRKANPDKVAENVRRHTARHPDRILARSAVGNAVKLGKIPPARNLTCSVCKAPAENYHHPDYSRPLDVIPVCTTCHTELHKEPKIK